MKKFYILLFAMFIVTGAEAQTKKPCLSCLPEGITFSTQNQIDSFQADYPGCTEIEGNVIIDGSYEIDNLNGLSILTSIWGNLSMSNNPALNYLTGLNNLTFIGGDFFIGQTPSLYSFEGLNNLTSIGGSLFIHNIPCYFLTSLAGLENLTEIGGGLSLYFADYLTSLTGLENLTSIGGSLDVSYSNALTTLAGLSSLTSIGGGLSIFSTALTSLTGLDNIAANSITNLEIIGNPSLSSCAVQSICDYLAAPNGTIEIRDNSSGCSSPEEVSEACKFGLEENATSESNITLYPSPSSNQITIETSTAPDKNTTLTIYNINGQVLTTRQIMKQQTVLDVSGLSQGIYFMKVSDDRTVMMGKFVKQ